MNSMPQEGVITKSKGDTRFMADNFNWTVSSLRSGLRAPLRLLGGAAAASLALSLAGCSTLSDSLSDSLSKSVSSPFESSSKSSSGTPKEREASYQDDLCKYAEVCSRSNCAGTELARGVAAIAEKYGVSNWEADSSTYTAIGAGLAKASTPQPQVDLYKGALAPADAAHADAIQKAFEKGSTK